MMFQDVKEAEVLRTFNPNNYTRLEEKRKRSEEKRKGKKGERKKKNYGFEATPVVIRTVAGP